MKTLIENLKSQVKKLHEEILRLEEEYLKIAGKPNPFSKGWDGPPRILSANESNAIHNFIEDWGPVSLYSLASHFPHIPVNAIYFYLEKCQYKYQLNKAGLWYAVSNNK